MFVLDVYDIEEGKIRDTDFLKDSLSIILS